MNLLIITQKVDRNDGVLGFFHNWIVKFAAEFDSLIVICLEKGEYDLPKNVKVLSLGKENGRSRLKYTVNFFRHIIRERKKYGAVLVHMTPIHILLGKFLWQLWHKEIFMWYNHEVGNRIAGSAVKSVNAAFYTSAFSFCAQFKNAIQMPAGVDTDHFIRDQNISKKENSILCLGRISPIKKIDILIETAKLLKAENIDFSLAVVGDPLEEHRNYLETLKESSEGLEQQGLLKYHGNIANYKTPEIYNKSQIYVNLSPSGLFDKTILEAMACETLVLVSGQAFKGAIDERFIFKENDPTDLAEKIKSLFALSKENKTTFGKELRQFAVDNHSLKELASRLRETVLQNR